uniref:Uncharacterized protein n=1 Tax=Picea sitchensis TaxID=3332 RepID=D5AAV5_PICSI|nr:unknown [Picea sitchensis]
MFSKYIASSSGFPLHSLAAAAVATLAPPFPRIVLLKLSLLSTSTAGNDRPTGYPEAKNTCPISEFLLNECGLCESQLSGILKKRPHLVRTRSTHTAQQAVQLLRDSGFTEDQVCKIITRNPSILTYNADRQLKPKIEFMKTLGLTAHEIGNVTCQGPRLLSHSIEKTVQPNILYLQNLFGSEADVSKVLKRVPGILVNTNMPERLRNKLKYLASFGIPENEIKDLVRRNPVILNVSMDKMQKNMDFIIHTAGLPAKFLLSCPLLPAFSLESRIKPRHKVLMSISALQPSERLPSLTYVLSLSERKFLEKYVNCSPYATKLLEIYRGKPVGLDVIQ